MLKWYTRGYDNLTHTFMWGKLNITVWAKETKKDYRAVVEYKGYTYCLPEDLNTLFDNILSQVEYKYDVAKIVYEKIEHEVNEMLARFQMREAQENLVQFQFPPAKEAPTIRIGGAATSIWWNPNTVAERIYTTYWNYEDTPMVSSRYDSVPIANYLTPEEYEQKKERWELNSWTIYLIYSN